MGATFISLFRGEAVRLQLRALSAICREPSTPRIKAWSTPSLSERGEIPQ